ncbi:hypothetical protein BRAS3809_4250003 [Bradyrhizobium sp. STM 3809]|nr:hypothetical protein BRAS3809_4250003 [Bradyrhizobium sp. STM 3809]
MFTTFRTAFFTLLFFKPLISQRFHVWHGDCDRSPRNAVRADPAAGIHVERLVWVSSTR